MYKFYSQPIEVEAVQFLPDGSNWDEVVTAVRLRGGFAEMHYLDKDGNQAAKGKITAYKGIALQVAPGQPVIPVFPGSYVMLNSDEFYAVPPVIFEEYHTKNIDDLYIGDFTFGDLRKEVERLNPPFEQVFTADKHKVDENMLAVDFLKQCAIIHQDSEGLEYFVINGQVFKF